MTDNETTAGTEDELENVRLKIILTDEFVSLISRFLFFFLCLNFFNIKNKKMI